MFSPLLPSLPFQACENCSQLVCVYPQLYRLYGILKIQFTHSISTITASWWSLFLWNGGILSSFNDQFGQRKTNKNLHLLKPLEEKMSASEKSWLRSKLITYLQESVILVSGAKLKFWLCQKKSFSFVSQTWLFNLLRVRLYSSPWLFLTTRLCWGFLHTRYFI